jgi:PST family polysaccharide transporter
VQHPEQARETLGSALGLRLVAGILGAVAATGLIVMLRPEQPMLQVLVGLMAFGLVFQASDVVTFWFQSQIQAKYDVQARSAAYGVASLARIGCILAQTSLAAIGLTYVLEPLLRAVGLGVIYRRADSIKEKWQFSFKRAKVLLRNSWPLILSGMAIMVYMRIDQVMLGQLANDESVGLYSAAVKLSEGWYFIPVAIASSIFPVILAAKQQSESQYYKQLSLLFKLVVAIAYTIALTITLGAHQLTTLLFGASYEDASIILAIHVWSGVFTSIGVIKDMWLTAESLLIFSFFITMSGAVLNVAVNYMLIPRFDAVGAAIATVISYIFANLLTCFAYPKTRCIGRIMLNSLIFKG